MCNGIADYCLQLGTDYAITLMALGLEPFRNAGLSSDARPFDHERVDPLRPGRPEHWV